MARKYWSVELYDPDFRNLRKSEFRKSHSTFWELYIFKQVREYNIDKKCIYCYNLEATNGLELNPNIRNLQI